MKIDNNKVECYKKQFNKKFDDSSISENGTIKIVKPKESEQVLRQSDIDIINTKLDTSNEKEINVSNPMDYILDNEE